MEYLSKVPRKLREARNTWNTSFRSNYDKHVEADLYQERVVRDGRQYIADTVANAFLDLLPEQPEESEPWKILDVATGTGLIAEALLSQGFKVIGTDLSQNLLAVNHEQNANVSLVRGNMNEGLPFTADSFNGVTSVWANRYMDRSKRFLLNTHRVLKNDGVLVWPIFPYEAPLWKFNSGMYQPTSIENIAEEARGIGFHDVQVRKLPYREQRDHGVHRLSVFDLLAARK